MFKARDTARRSPTRAFWSFESGRFGFVSGFEIRISGLGLKFAVSCLVVTGLLFAAPLETDYYTAVPTPVGTIDFHARTGRVVVAGIPGFQARYYAADKYHDVTADVTCVPRIEESGDTILVTTEQNLGRLTLTRRFTLTRHSPLVECRVRLDYHERLDTVFYEILVTNLPAESARVVTRTQQLVTPDRWRPWITDKWTTRAAQFGGNRELVTFPGEDNLTGLRLQWRDDHWSLVYDIDRAFNHPFFRAWDIVPNYPTYETLATTDRAPGDTAGYYFRFAIGARVPILKRERQPDGYEAALIFTEHADCQSTITAKAIAYGSSETDTPLVGRGLLGNGLTFTKSVFRWHTWGSRNGNLGYYGLDRPDFKAVIDEQHRRGVEIALHTPSALTDSADTVGATLRDMQDWYGIRTWIDHGLDFNFEGVGKFGTWPESTAWFILDTLREYGVRYLWLPIDMPGFGVTDHNLFAPAWPDFYPPILYSQPRLDATGGAPGRNRGLFFWPSFAPATNSDRDFHISPGAVNDLIAERGVDIVHVYFSAQDTFVSRRRPTYANWLLLHGNWPFISWETDPWVDACFQYMADRQRNRLLRVTTIANWADYLLLSDSVELAARDNGEFLVINHARRPVSGFALSIDAAGVRDIRLEDRSVTSRKPAGPDILFWFDVPPDTTLHLRIETWPPVFNDRATAPPQNPHLAHHGSTAHRIFTAPGEGLQTSGQSAICTLQSVICNKLLLFERSSNRGQTWSAPETISIGDNPSLALDRTGLPLVSFDSLGVLHARRRHPSGTWEVLPVEIDTATLYVTAAGALTASRLNDDSLGSLFYLTYTADRRRTPALAANSAIRLVIFDPVRTWLDTLIAAADIPGNCLYPGISITPGDIIHVTWQHGPDSAGSINYRTCLSPLTPAQVRQGALPVFSPAVELATGARPVVSAIGDSVAVCYQAPVAGINDIYRRTHWLPDSFITWLPAENLSRSPTRESSNPTAQGRVVLWQEADDNAQPDIAGRIGPQPLTIEHTPDASLYPQVDARWQPCSTTTTSSPAQATHQAQAPSASQSAICNLQSVICNEIPVHPPPPSAHSSLITPQSSLFNLQPSLFHRHSSISTRSSLNQPLSLTTFWTEAVARDSLWELRLAQTEITLPVPLPDYTVICGESVPSPYCRHRTGFRQQGGHRFDVGTDSLVYSLPWLDPARNYQLLCRLYNPEPDTQPQAIYLGDSLIARATIPPGESESLLISIPMSFYALTARVRLRTAPVMEGIALFASDRDTVLLDRALPGNPQSSLFNLQSSIFNLLVSPNPASFRNPHSELRIDYALPHAGPASLKLFDVTGRLVRTLSKGYRNPGSYTISVHQHESAAGLNSGIYILRLETPTATATTKLVID